VSEIRHTSSLDQTIALAAEFARRLRPGDFVALEGELGAGKTQFVRGLVQGLGGDTNAVSSPTFVLLNIYNTPVMKVFHLDAYRISSGEDLEAIGFDELLEQGGVVVVEWWTRVKEIVPQNRWLVRLTTLSTHRREIEIVPPVARG
jgi:tRNA threonylcarbamoyladenosine biosynthesis protein TsaE